MKRITPIVYTDPVSVHQVSEQNLSMLYRVSKIPSALSMPIIIKYRPRAVVQYRGAHTLSPLTNKTESDSDSQYTQCPAELFRFDFPSFGYHRPPLMKNSQKHHFDLTHSSKYAFPSRNASPTRGWKIKYHMQSRR